MRIRMVLRVALISLSSLLPVAAQTAASVPASSAATAVPPLVPYSGIAKDAAGKPLSGEIGITFLIYKDQEGGSPLWMESQRTAVDVAGHFQVQLGAMAVNGLPIDLFSTGEARWLEVQIAGLAPESRVLLVSVPYALKAADAATLGGLPASAFALAGSKAVVAAASVGQTVTPDVNATVTTPGGTTGYLPVFTGAATVADSILYASSTGVGVGDVPNSTAVFDVNGKSIWRGLMNVSRAGNATDAAGFDSYAMFFQASVYNSSSKAAVLPNFQLQVEPTGNDTATPGETFNVLSSATGGTPAETGLYFNSNGIIHFATGQTFPGAGGGGSGTITGVTAGTDLTGGGTTGVVTLNLDTTKVPLLTAANTFTGNQKVTGTLSTTGELTAAAGLTSAGAVGIGTTTPRSLLEVEATASAALGPVVTLTNTAGGGGAMSALDFNTKLPSTTGTYNPMARIAAMDALHYSDNLVFLSNTPGVANNGLETNMIIQSNGQTGINTTAPGAQLEVDANPTLGTDAIYGFGATVGTGAGSLGVEGTGGESLSTFTGGSGGNFTGGYAEGTGIGGDGVDAYAGDSAESDNEGYAGYFGGSIFVTGTVLPSDVKATIDHPLDPANKYLVQATVQSSEMVNIYSGNVTTDELGVATVRLPDWFEAENADFRYQLTVVGKFAQAIISQEIANHQFKISTNASFTKVSWQVTGVRQDVYAKAHPLVVEREKTGVERGYYVHPELYGQPAEKQTQWARHREMMKKQGAERQGTGLRAQSTGN
jgi:hypothetical protein